MRKRKREKKPVLTSPWKIGMLVALLLATTSFGVGYYMVRMYNIDLYWLSTDVSMWVVDSYEFFKQIYPAAAGVILLSVFAYFIIASAVRRYRYYLSSGQDYRKMVSLADSIDDLTNPAQIARLSDFPELQGVLRNYGDQIREISAGMEEREQEMRSVDLEVEIDNILKGGKLNETLADGKWWAPIARKVQEWSESGPEGSDETRQLAARASLTCGKISETASGAGEDIREIISSVGELSARVRELGSGDSGASVSPVASTDAVSAAADALQEKGSAIHELSEESNGLALNIALMAARGEACEKDLAGLAEKVRSAAERFGRLGRELDEIARSIAGDCGSAPSGGQPSGSSAVSASSKALADVSERIESRSRELQQKLIVLGKDIQDMRNAFDIGGPGADGPAVEEGVEPADGRERTVDGSLVNFGAGDEEPASARDVDSAGLVIDHGKVWEGSDEAPEQNDEVSPAEKEAAGSDDESGELLISGFQEAMSSMQAGAGEEPQSVQIESTAEEESPSEQKPAEEQAMEEEPASGPVAGSPDEWSEIQQGGSGDWMKVDVEQVDEDGSVEPEVVPEQAAEEPQQPREYEIPAEQAVPDEASETAEDEEPVYDLFELGAVEYKEETEVNL